MVKVLPDAEVDVVGEAVDAVMTAAEEHEALVRFAPSGRAGDLSDGGVVNGATLTPMAGGKKLAQGRPNVRRAWMWNGTESMLPLAYNPEGTRHDGARPYLLKRHCLCCQRGGFKGRQCPNCVKNDCQHCKLSTDPSKIIRSFYLRKEEVPFPTRFYGDIDCFLPECERRGSKGFLNGLAMRLHAASRHGKQYSAYLESLAAEKAEQDAKRVTVEREEIAALRARLDALTATQLVVVPKAETVMQEAVAPKARTAAQQAAVERMRAGRAAKRAAKRATEGVAQAV